MSSFDIPAESKAIQRQVVLEALGSNPSRTTSELREMGIMMPASRILELRRAGWGISTTMIWSADRDGVMHKQARYVLERSPA